MVGTVLYDSIWLIGTYDCINAFVAIQCRVKEQVIALIYITLKLIFLGEQAMFLLLESDLYAKYGRSNTNRVVYAINSVANFTIIVYTILYESKLAIQPDSYISENESCSTDILPNTTFHHIRHVHACLNSTTGILRVATGLEVYMYTYHSEFCILATSLNMMLWNASASTNKADGEDSESQTTGVRSISAEQMEATNDTDDEETSGLLPISSEINRPREEEVFVTADFTGIAVRGQRGTRSSSGGYGSLSGASAPANDDDVGLANPTPERDSNSISTLKDCFLSFKECYKCEECLDPNPERIYGSDNGCGCLAFIGFAIIVLCTILSLLQHNYKDSYNLDTPVYAISVVEFAAMTVASILLAIVSTRKLNRGPSIPRKFSVGSIVIMVSALLMHVFNFLCIIAACNLLLHRSKKNLHLSTTEFYRCVTDIIEVVFDSVHVAMQTKLVLNINWIMKRNRPCDVRSSSTMMQCVTFLMVGNFSKWILGTVIEIQDPGVNSSEQFYFGTEAWHAVVYTFYPFVVYFRFHCSMALAEYMLWRRGIKNERRRVPFLSSIGTFTYY
jgi:hypothetical protein